MAELKDYKSLSALKRWGRNYRKVVYSIHFTLVGHQ